MLYFTRKHHINEVVCPPGTVSFSVCSTAALVFLLDLSFSQFLGSWLKKRVLPSTLWLIQVVYVKDLQIILQVTNRPGSSSLSGPGLAFITYPQAAAMMPLPQFWTACFFLMVILLAVDTHVIITFPLAV